MEQIGFIRNTKGDMVEVEVRRISGCGGGCSSCGGSCSMPSMIISMKNSVNAKKGDYVEIRAKSEKIIKYALIVYMIPFAMLVLGIFLGINIFQSMGMDNYETYGFIIGLIFLIISYIIVKRIDNRIKGKNENVMEIIRILEI